MGCIMAELFTGNPLLPGQSETDMLMKLSKLIGNIPHTWEKGFEVAKKTGVNFMPGSPVDPSIEQIMQLLQNAIPQASANAIDLIYQMIQWNPD